jgi:hypothetical protein
MDELSSIPHGVLEETMTLAKAVTTPTIMLILRGKGV